MKTTVPESIINILIFRDHYTHKKFRTHTRKLKYVNINCIYLQSLYDLRI